MTSHHCNLSLEIVFTLEIVQFIYIIRYGHFEIDINNGLPLFCSVPLYIPCRFAYYVTH